MCDKKHIDTILESAEKQCKMRGVRFTLKRKIVLQGLIQSQKALSAYELIDFCKKEYGKVIAAMSIYRILEFLESQQLVHKLSLAKKYVACSHINCEREHGVPQFLICNSCNKVKEIVIPPSVINGLQENAYSKGFKLVSPQIEMNCLCEDCAKKADNYGELTRSEKCATAVG
ncbi:MAG: Fur family transcriptional regulator [Pseudomonadota bacterium]